MIDIFNNYSNVLGLDLGYLNSGKVIRSARTALQNWIICQIRLIYIYIYF